MVDLTTPVDDLSRTIALARLREHGKMHGRTMSEEMP